MMDISQSPFDRKAQRGHKRQAILSTASWLFNTKGPHATTLSDITEQLNLTKTSLYYYVRTKEELIYLCYLVTCEWLADLIDLERPKAENFFPDLFADYITSFHAARKQEVPHRAVLTEIAALESEHRADISARYTALFDAIHTHIESLVMAGKIRPLNTTATTHAYFSTLQWSVAWLGHLSDIELKRAPEHIHDIMLNGLATNHHSLPDFVRTRPVANVTSDDEPEDITRTKIIAFIRTGSSFFNRKGYPATSLDEIADAIDVTKGAFYYYIKNKEDLLVKCFERTLKLMKRSVEKANENGQNGLEKLYFAAARLFVYQNSDCGPLVRSGLLITLPMEKRRPLLDQFQAVSDQFGAFINEGITDGSVRAVNPFIAQELLIGTVMGSDAFADWGNVDDPVSAAKQYLDFILRGFSVPPSKTRKKQ